VESWETSNQRCLGTQRILAIVHLFRDDDDDGCVGVGVGVRCFLFLVPSSAVLVDF
jgi:hypothetical protein